MSKLFTSYKQQNFNTFYQSSSSSKWTFVKRFYFSIPFFKYQTLEATFTLIEYTEYEEYKARLHSHRLLQYRRCKSNEGIVTTSENTNILHNSTIQYFPWIGNQQLEINSHATDPHSVRTFKSKLLFISICLTSNFKLLTMLRRFIAYEYSTRNSCSYIDVYRSQLKVLTMMQGHITYECSKWNSYSFMSVSIAS